MTITGRLPRYPHWEFVARLAGAVDTRPVPGGTLGIYAVQLYREGIQLFWVYTPDARTFRAVFAKELAAMEADGYPTTYPGAPERDPQRDRELRAGGLMISEAVRLVDDVGTVYRTFSGVCGDNTPPTALVINGRTSFVPSPPAETSVLTVTAAGAEFSLPPR